MQANTLEGNQNDTSELKMNTSGGKKTERLRRYWVHRVKEVDNSKDQADESTASANFCDTYKGNISLKEHYDKNYGLKSKEFVKTDYKTDCRIDSGNICSNVLCTNCCDDPAESNYKYVCCCEEKTSLESKEIDRQLSGSSEEKLPAKGVGEKSPLSQTYKNVLEEMVEKVNEKEDEKQQKMKSEKQANEVEPTDSENLVENDDKKPDSENSEVLPSNWWTANISKANEMKNKKEGTKSTQDDNNSKKNKVSNSNENGKNRIVSWWNSKSSTTGKTAAQKDDSNRKSGGSSTKNNPSCLNPSAETNITNSENGTSFRNILSLFYSFFAGIVAFFYGLLSRAVTGRDSNAESSAPEFLANPEVTALIPESLRRRNTATTVKEKSNVSSWMKKKNGGKN